MTTIASTSKSTTLILPFEPFPARRAGPKPCVPGRRFPGMAMNHQYRAWRTSVEEWIDSQDLPILPDGPLSIAILHLRKRPKVTKLAYPAGDFDNLSKAITDCFNKRLFRDDNDIVNEATGKRWAAPGQDGCIVVHITQTEIKND